MKTVLAPAFKARLLGLSGWYSTNILGNRDGEVLDDPGSFKTKEESKLGALEHILQPALYPELYGNIFHKVRINYYPPRGDNKEGWDNIDIFGWLGYPMQIKVDFLCRDSILAAPIVLDLVLFLDLAQRTPELRRLGHSGMAELLLQVAHDRARPLSRARSVHSADEAEEHTAAFEGRRADHAPGAGVLRLRKFIWCGDGRLARPSPTPISGTNWDRPSERPSPDGGGADGGHLDDSPTQLMTILFGLRRVLHARLAHSTEVLMSRLCADWSPHWMSRVPDKEGSDTLPRRRTLQAYWLSAAA